MKKIPLNRQIENLGLPCRCTKHFVYGGLKTLADIVSEPKSYLLKFKNIGKNTLEEWSAFLEENGLHFNMSEEEMKAYDPSYLKSDDNGEEQDSIEISPNDCENAINWEERHWGLATQLFKEFLSKDSSILHLMSERDLSHKCEIAIDTAKKFVEQYKEKMD